MPPRLTAADERVDAVRGCVAIERGPLVYCVEQVDQAEGVVIDDLALVGEELSEQWRPDLLGGVVVVHAAGAVTAAAPSPAGLYHDATPTPAPAPEPAAERVDITAVPYALWANRKVGAMRVWMPRHDESAPS
jgi:DUF1680 family protein